MNIITKITKQATWAELKAAAEAGTIDEIIKSGDLIPFNNSNYYTANYSCGVALGFCLI